jgi:hypothetical protein
MQAQLGGRGNPVPRPPYPRQESLVVTAEYDVWRGEEYLSPQVFESRTFQTVASCYSDWDIPAPSVRN